MADEVRIRVHSANSEPTLIYLPGLHGNWTLIGRFRKALGARVRFVESAYPPTLTWSLDDLAAGVEEALARQGIHRGWLLAESFSSQVAWPILARGKLEVEGMILAGGFVRYPMRRIARLAQRFCRDVSFSLLTLILFGYAKAARWRFRNSPETQRGIEEFIANLTESERQAAEHRIHLVANSDLCAIAREAKIPVYALTGFFDPVVPWFGVRHWLKKHCPSLREYKVLFA